MARKFLITAIVATASAPLLVGIGLALSHFMPHCTWAASAPAGGCELLGLNLNWLITASTVAFAISFFSVPIGLVGVLVGLFLGAREGKA